MFWIGVIGLEYEAPILMFDWFVDSCWRSFWELDYTFDYDYDWTAARFRSLICLFGTGFLDWSYGSPSILTELRLSVEWGAFESIETFAFFRSFLPFSDICSLLTVSSFRSRILVFLDDFWRFKGLPSITGASKFIDTLLWSFCRGCGPLILIKSRFRSVYFSWAVVERLRSPTSWTSPYY